MTKEYWNTLFENRKGMIGFEKVLIEFEEFHSGGKLLDIASGDGRNLEYFVSKNYSVTCIDYSIIGLRKTEERAKCLKTQIKTYLSDIREGIPKLNEEYDLISIIHYYPGIETIRNLAKHISNSGNMLIISFLKADQMPGTSKYDIAIDQEEIVTLSNVFDVIKKVEYNDERGKQIGLMIKRNSLTTASTG
jgi:cyclopropane fatty-acyl-phospholipid synthase-like methyltransferase